MRGSYSKIVRELKQSILQFLIECVAVFILLLLAISYEFWLILVLPYHIYPDQQVIGTVIQKTIVTALLVTVSLHVLKSSVLLVIRAIFSRLPKDDETFKGRLITIAIDTFVAVAVILCFLPVRPVLHEAFDITSSVALNLQFVRFDAMPSVIILTYFGAFAALCIFLWQRTKYGLLKIVIMIGVIFVVANMNNTPNFKARISETRAAWTHGEYHEQIESAHAALAVARTNEEKALAYYWIGVGHNRLNKPAEAVTYQKKSIALDPEAGYQYSSLAMAYNTLRDFKNASESAAICIEKSPKYAWCYLALFDYYFLKEVNMEKADENLRKAEQLEPDNREIRELRANFEKDKKRVIEAQSRGEIWVWDL